MDPFFNDPFIPPAERFTLQVVDSTAKVSEMKLEVGSIQEFERLEGILKWVERPG